MKLNYFTDQPCSCIQLCVKGSQTTFHEERKDPDPLQHQLIFLSGHRPALFPSIENSFMEGNLGKIKVISDHFEVPTPSEDSPQINTPSASQPSTDSSLRLQLHSHSWTRRKLKSAAVMLNMFSLRGLPWVSSSDGQEKVELTATELESLRSELADLEDREAHLKAQLEHVDEILRSARLSGYLYIRTRWKPLPGEPPPIDDTDVDDWLPRFIVLHGSCIFFYLLSTDLSPQDSTVLSDVVEVASLPSITRENGEMRYCFYILTRHGLRIECSSISKIQVYSWLSALQTDCKLDYEPSTPNGSSENNCQICTWVKKTEIR
ncbi:nucleoside diphosphate kinase [Citrus sinensis]|nr:uncharacterized protein LOC18049587 isoform X1 [Citrus x clementina]XP_052293960.1 uncharacterized protein LOC102608324 isoform X1 [Citrus sinensis]KAH9719155.1 nucleoside diphosphate kinase [Citrus sinensis]